MCHVLVAVSRQPVRRVNLEGKYSPEQFNKFRETLVQAVAELQGVVVFARNGQLQSFTTGATSSEQADRVADIVHDLDWQHCNGLLQLTEAA